MRISSSEIHRQASQQMQALGAQTAITQQQISHGKRLINPSDDPVGAARVVTLKQELATRQQMIDNADSANTHLALEDSVLNQVIQSVQRIQELTIQAGAGTNTLDDRRYIASEISQRFEELMSLVNTQGANGQYLFAGYKSETVPFTIEAGAVRYHGDSGQRTSQLDRGQFIEINDSGNQLFMQVGAIAVNATATFHPVDAQASDASIQNLDVIDEAAVAQLHPDKLIVEFSAPAVPGELPSFSVRRQSDLRIVDGLQDIPYESGQPVTAAGLAFTIEGSAQPGDQFTIATHENKNLLDSVNELAIGLRSIEGADNPQALRALIDSTIVSLDNATDNILEVRAEIGARFNAIDSAKQFHQDVSVQTQETLSAIEDLDFAEAVSRLSFQSFVLEAAQQSFIRISGLSLFNRL